MRLTPEQLATLEEYAAALITPAEIAILLAIEPKHRNTFVVRCKMDIGTEEYEAYNRGRLTTKLELRKNVIKLAKAGSPAAEPLAEKYLAAQNL